MSNQEWYAVLRHRWGNPDTRFAVTCPYCRTLSTLPADGTLALEARRGTKTNHGCKPGRVQTSIKNSGAHRGAEASESRVRCAAYRRKRPEDEEWF